MTVMNDVADERRDRRNEDGEWPAVSVIIITRDRHESAVEAVHSVLQVDYPTDKLEVVVVEETDKPEPIEGEQVHYIAIPRRNLGFGFARNQGVKHSKGEVFAFTDDDCLVHRNWLRDLVGALQAEEGAAAVSGAVLVPECGPVGECENILGFPGGGVKFVADARGKVVHRVTFSTCNCAVYRWAVEEVGGFQEANKSGGEDEALSRQISARHPMLYTPHAIVWHEPRDHIIKVYHWFVRRGLGRAEMARNSPTGAMLYYRMILQSPFVRLAVVSGIAVAVGIPLWLAVLGLLALYYFSVLYRYRWSRRHYRAWKTFLVLPWVKAVMDVAMDIGTAKKLLARSASGG